MQYLSTAILLFAAIVISGCSKSDAKYTSKMPKGFEDCVTAEMTIQGVQSRLFRCPEIETHTFIDYQKQNKKPKNYDIRDYQVADKDHEERVSIKTPKDDKLTNAVSVNGIIYRVNNDLTEIMVDAKTEQRLADSISINGIEYRREQPKKQ